MVSSWEVNILTASKYQDPSFDVGRLDCRLLKSSRKVSVSVCSIYIGGFFCHPKLLHLGAVGDWILDMLPVLDKLTQYINFNTLRPSRILTYSIANS